jgi:hypothetical protein
MRQATGQVLAGCDLRFHAYSARSYHLFSLYTTKRSTTEIAPFKQTQCTERRHVNRILLFTPEQYANFSFYITKKQ